MSEAKNPNAERLLREHNYFYQDQFGDIKTGFYYCLCGWEGPDRSSYWKHLEALQSVPSPVGQPELSSNLQDNTLETNRKLRFALDSARAELKQELDWKKRATQAESSLEKLRERIEALPRYENGNLGMQTWPGGDWLERHAVLAEFEKEGK